MGGESITITKYSTHAAILIRDVFGYQATVVRKFLKSNLTSVCYNKRYRRFVPNREYHSYDRLSKSLLIPINFTEPLLKELQKYEFDVIVKFGKNVVGRLVHISMQPQWVDRPAQLGALKHLIDPNGGHVRTIGLQTGVGKTMVAIKTITRHNMVSMIVTAGLVEQWKREFLKLTDIQETDIWVLRGQKSFLTLFADPEIRPKVFIASLATIRAYVRSNTGDYPITYREFLEQYGIGVKVNDECHTHFHFISQLDLRSHIEHNIYLSATYTNSDKSTLAIFDEVFPKVKRYGARDYDRYVDIRCFLYRLDIREQDVTGPHGYDHRKYEEVVLHCRDDIRDKFLELTVYPMVRNHYLSIRTTNQKLLILVSKIKSVKLLVEQLSIQHPNLVIKPYTAVDPDDNYADGVDIIVSTPTSAGTGRDISNLRTVISTVSTKSEALIKQILGRLRKLPNGDTPEFIDMCNVAVASHQRHRKLRSMLISPLARTYEERTLY